jgi:hypothetical protein
MGLDAPILALSADDLVGLGVWAALSASGWIERRWAAAGRAALPPSRRTLPSLGAPPAGSTLL